MRSPNRGELTVLEHWLLLFLAVCLWSPLGAQATIRDSVGIRIIENPARVGSPVSLRLVAVPSLDLGGLKSNPEDEFVSTAGYLRWAQLSTGGVAAIDVTRIRYFDASRKQVTVAGRNGAGPGEYRSLTSICRTRGDTIVVFDTGTQRVGVLDGRGKFVRHIPYDRFGIPPWAGCFDDGTYLSSVSQPPVQGTRAMSQVSRLRLDGTLVQVLGLFPRTNYSQAVSAEVTIAAQGGRMYVGDPTLSEIKVYSNMGKLVQVIRTRDEAGRLTDREIDRMADATIPANAPRSAREAERERLRRMPRPGSMPFFGRICVDPAGRTWVQDYRLSREKPDIWTGFDSQGKMIGRVIIPAPAGQVTQVVDFGRDGVMLRVNDTDGAAHLREYRIVPIKGASR